MHLRLPRRIIRVWISNKMFIWAVNHQILRYQHAEIDPNFPPSCGGGQIIQIRQGRTIPRILGIYSTIKSTSRDSDSRFYFGSQPRNSSAALSGSVRRPCIPTTFAAAPPAWSRLLTETSFLLLHQELSVVCSCCSSTERHAVMLAHVFSWLARTFGRQMFWQWRNQMTCFHGTNSLFEIRKKEKKKNKKQCEANEASVLLKQWRRVQRTQGGYSVDSTGTGIPHRGVLWCLLTEPVLGSSCSQFCKHYIHVHVSVCAKLREPSSSKSLLWKGH